MFKMFCLVIVSLVIFSTQVPFICCDKEIPQSRQVTTPQSPQVTTPQVTIPQSSQVKPQSPQVTPQSSQVTPQSPQVTPQSSQVTPQSSQVTPQSPQVTTPQSPQVTTPQSPQVTTPQSPQVTISQSPQVTTPQVTTPQSPQVTTLQVTATQSPQVTTPQSPQVTTKRTEGLDPFKPITPDLFACGDGRCLCDLPNTLVTCSHIYGGINYIPAFPSGITDLDFTHQDMTSYTKLTAEFFANATAIRKLVIIDNTNLPQLELGCLDELKQLRELYLGDSGTPITPAVVGYLIRIPYLLKLSLENNNIGTLPRETFRGRASSVRALSFGGNKMMSANLDDFANYFALNDLSLQNNRLRNVQMTLPMRFLGRLNLGNNALDEFPVSCAEDNTTPLFPELFKLDLHGNSLRNIRPDICLPKLIDLDLSGNRFGEFLPGTFNSAKFPKLRSLTLARSMRVESEFTVSPILWHNTFSNKVLSYVNLENCNLNFAAEAIHTKAFENCTLLEVLILDGNTFRHVNETRFRELFGVHDRLYKLGMANCKLNKVTTVSLAGLTNLKELNLRDNMISNIPDGAFDAMPKLQKLDLSGNAISVVKEWTFSDKTRNGLQQLVIGNNPFSCTCDLLWFRNWLRTNPGLLEDAPINFRKVVYGCDNLPNTKVKDFILHPQACLLSPETSKMITGVLSLIVLTMTGFLLLFSYRWHLRLLLYEAFRGRDDGVRQRRLQQNNFDYDVFVSYASEDLPWVQQHLLPQLEDRLGLKLCIHERDFIIGNNIVDNIAECVERSKKILMVFSKYFLRSHWCQFELTYCLRHVMDYDDNLIIVCVDDVVSREMTTAMMAVLKTTTYIQWAELGEAVQSFWGRLKIALNEIVAQV